MQADLRMLKIEECKAQPIDASRGRLPHSVVDRQPAFWRFDRRRAQANLVRIPPSSASRFQDGLMTSPMPQIWRIGYPHMSAKRCHWPVNQRPTTTNPPGQQRRIFILRRHDYAVALEASEVPGERQGDSRTAARKGSVGHRVLIEFRDIGNARIFDAPDFFRIVQWIRHQRRLRINLPSIQTIRGTRGAKMR